MQLKFSAPKHPPVEQSSFVNWNSNMELRGGNVDSPPSKQWSLIKESKTKYNNKMSFKAKATASYHPFLQLIKTCKSWKLLAEVIYLLNCNVNHKLTIRKHHTKIKTSAFIFTSSYNIREKKTTLCVIIIRAQVRGPLSLEATGEIMAVIKWASLLNNTSWELPQSFRPLLCSSSA